MEFLKVVKEKQLTTDTMFDPLGQIIEMLRGYGVVIPEESLVQLQELPEKWGNTKRLSVQAIQQVFDYFLKYGFFKNSFLKESISDKLKISWTFHSSKSKLLEKSVR